MASAQHDYLEQDTIEFYPEDEYYASEEFNPDEYFYDLETMQALEELYAEYDNAMNQEAMQPWNTYNDSTYQQHLVYDANARRAAREKMALTKRHKKPTMLMAAYGNGLISTDRNATVNGSSSAMLLPAAGGSTMMMAPGITPKVAPPVNYSYHHHMPLTAGLTFSKRITRNIYGNVGVNFTSMSSDVTPALWHAMEILAIPRLEHLCGSRGNDGKSGVGKVQQREREHQAATVVGSCHRRTAVQLQPLHWHLCRA